MHIILYFLLCITAHLIFLVDHLYNTFRFRFRERWFFLWWFTGLFRCLLLKLFLVQKLNNMISIVKTLKWGGGGGQIMFPGQ